MYRIALASAPVAFIASRAFATSEDLTAFNAGMASGTDTGVGMLQTFGAKGVILTLVSIAAAVVIALIGYGAALGWKALKGRFKKH